MRWTGSPGPRSRSRARPVLRDRWGPPPETEQPGLKDTVLVPGQCTVELVAWLDNPGEWMAHCHILEHAALGMMEHFVVREAD